MYIDVHGYCNFSPRSVDVLSFPEQRERESERERERERGERNCQKKVHLTEETKQSSSECVDDFLKESRMNYNRPERSV